MEKSFIKSVDERTSLAGANRLEVLLFSLGFDHNVGREEVFGINVFKVREVMHVPPITHAPDTPPAVEGLVSLRGAMVPIINLAKFCGMDVRDSPKILIVTEYNRNTQALLVNSVEHILRMEWNEIKVPPSMLAHRMGGLVTAVTELQDKRIVMILDVEKILFETAEFGQNNDAFLDLEPLSVKANVLYADDSSVARKQIETTFSKMGVTGIATRNGREAWDKLLELHERAESAKRPLGEFVNAVLTDIEMPEMDGYVLTKKIKNDPRFSHLPVVMHSSLSATANITIGKDVGADIYVPKFHPRELADALAPLLE